MSTTTGGVTANKGDLIERVSYVSSATHGKDGDAYNNIKTPDVEGGALRQGGAPNVYGKEGFGLLCQYAAVGMVYGTLPGLVYPFLTIYLNMEGTQTTSASVLILLPWSFKVLNGMLSDCFPIFGFRRRPWILIWWTICFTMCVLMAVMKQGDPYFPTTELREKTELTEAEDALLNKDAPDTGGKFIIMMMLASVGYVGAAASSDGVVCEFAQREPESVRGTTQSAIYMVRTLFGVLAQLVSGFLFNGEQYGGEFGFTLTFPQMMLILALFLLPIFPITWFLIPEERNPGVSFKTYMAEFWELLQTRAMYQVIAYKFFSGVFERFVWVAAGPVANFWIGVTPLNDKLQGIFGNLVLAFTIWATSKWGLQWNWRLMTAITLLMVIALDAVVTSLGVWNVVRSQWFWLGIPIVETLPDGVNFIIGTYVVVELAGMGNEGAVYGLVTTVSNLSSPFASTISKNINSNFKVYNDDIKLDTTEVRWDVTYTIWIAYAARFVSLCFLPLLPPQKAATQELRRTGGSSKMFGIFTVFYVVFALCWSVTMNILSIYPSTKCLRVAGGRGCTK